MAVLLVLCLAQAKLLSVIFSLLTVQRKVYKSTQSYQWSLCHTVIKRTREIKTEIIRQKLCPQPHSHKAVDEGGEDEGGHMN